MPARQRKARPAIRVSTPTTARGHGTSSDSEPPAGPTEPRGLDERTIGALGSEHRGARARRRGDDGFRGFCALGNLPAGDQDGVRSTAEAGDQRLEQRELVRVRRSVGGARGRVVERPLRGIRDGGIGDRGELGHEALRAARIARHDRGPAGAAQPSQVPPRQLPRRRPAVPHEQLAQVPAPGHVVRGCGALLHPVPRSPREMLGPPLVSRHRPERVGSPPEPGRERRAAARSQAPPHRARRAAEERLDVLPALALGRRHRVQRTIECALGAREVLGRVAGRALERRAPPGLGAAPHRQRDRFARPIGLDPVAHPLPRDPSVRRVSLRRRVQALEKRVPRRGHALGLGGERVVGPALVPVAEAAHDLVAASRGRLPRPGEPRHAEPLEGGLRRAGLPPRNPLVGRLRAGSCRNEREADRKRHQLEIRLCGGYLRDQGNHL